MQARPVGYPIIINPFSRTEIPCYSSRLNKKILDEITTSRLITYLCSGDRKLVNEAVNILLAKSYQNKLLLHAQTVIYEQTKYQTPTLFDALIQTIAKLEVDQQQPPPQNNQDDEDEDGGIRYKLNILGDDSSNLTDDLISRVVAILRNAILQPPNDQIIASNPTAVSALLEILHHYFRFKTTVTEGEILQPHHHNITANTPRYILEIFSKIIKRLPLKQQHEEHASGHITRLDIKYILFNNLQHPVLQALPAGTARKLLETLEMATFIYDDDDALMACLETFEMVSKPSSFRSLIDDILLKPTYEPLFEQIVSAVSSPPLIDTPTLDSNHNNNNNNNNINNNNHQSITSPSSTSSSSSSSTPQTTSANTPIIPPTVLHLKQSPITFNKRTLIARLVELLGHSNNDIQLASLNAIYNLAKTSQKTRIMICHLSGLARHLCNLLSYKPGDHMMEMGKRSAILLSYLSKDQLNLGVLLAFEPLLAQIALTDTPHTDIITNILIKLETYKN